MSWFAVGGAALTAVSGYAKSKSDKKKAEQDKKDGKEMTREESQMSMLRSKYDSDLEYAAAQRVRKNKEGGLAEFRKFSTMQNWAPNYEQTNPGIVVPETPDALGKDYNLPEEEVAEGQKKKKSTLEKIDPLGSKILGGLFG